MSFESFSNNQESAPISREAVLDALKINGKEDLVFKDLFEKWINQKGVERKNIPPLEKEKIFTFDMELAIDTALLYRDAGLLNEAWEELNTAGEIAFNAGRDDTCDRLHGLLDELEPKMGK